MIIQKSMDAFQMLDIATIITISYWSFYHNSSPSSTKNVQPLYLISINFIDIYYMKFPFELTAANNFLSHLTSFYI